MGDLSKHFSRWEFECKCGCGFDTVDVETLGAAETIRAYFDARTTITSGCRCEAYNYKIGGAKNSQHKKGRGLDIVVDGVSPKEVAEFAEELGLSVGRYNTFTHIDTRSGSPARWDYST